MWKEVKIKKIQELLKDSDGDESDCFGSDGEDEKIHGAYASLEKAKLLHSGDKIIKLFSYF